MSCGEKSRLALGTAQWGMPYGIANRTGPPTADEMLALLDAARCAGVRTLDTARAYGDGEARIGALIGGDADWTVVTKLDPGVGAPSLGRRGALSRVDESVDRSREALRRDRLDVLLLHRAYHRHAWGGALWERLQVRREAGDIGRLGVSAGSPAEAWALLDEPGVEVLQVAASLFDQRLARDGFFARAERLGKPVYVRSPFLQGAGHLAVDELPGPLRGLAPALRAIDAWAEAGGIARGDALLLYLRDLVPARVVIGCETAAQLRANLAAWGRAGEWREALAGLAARIGPLGAELVDPSRWPAAVDRSVAAGAGRPGAAAGGSPDPAQGELQQPV